MLLGSGARRGGNPTGAPSIAGPLPWPLVTLALALALAASGCQKPAPASTTRPESVTTKPISVTEAEAKVAKAEAELTAAKAGLKAAVVANRQSKCRWAMGLLGILAVVSAAGAYFMPLWRWKLAGGALLCLGLIPVAAFASKLAPWWNWIGLGLLAAFALAAVAAWRRDHLGLSQVVNAVEDVKLKMPSTWETVASNFRNRIDQSIRPAIKALARKGRTP